MRDPSLTMFPFGWPSSVSCVTDSTTGTAGGIRHHAIRSAPSATTAPATVAHNQRELETWEVATTGPLPESDRASSAKARSDAVKALLRNLLKTAMHDALQARRSCRHALRYAWR